jgi:hypothetical protein
VGLEKLPRTNLKPMTGASLAAHPWAASLCAVITLFFLSPFSGRVGVGLASCLTILLGQTDIHGFDMEGNKASKLKQYLLLVYYLREEVQSNSIEKCWYK